eukprot:m.491846 g.491846  ORF g.491846 m.491846 type:complete len:271 (+) comp57272_c0_seq1:50-862(+)
MLLSVLALAVCALAAPAPRSSGSYGTPGDYDLLLFVRFWTPEACIQEYDETCEHLSASDWAADNLSLHGLWPQYTTSEDDHAYPEECYENNSTYWNSVSRLSSTVTSQFQTQWSQYAPEYIYGLDTHEWQEHGTCYSQYLIDTAGDQTALNKVVTQYFTNQMTLMQANPTPSIITNAASSKQSVSLSSLQAAMGGADMVGLSCDYTDGKAYLNSVVFCYGKDSAGNPTTRIQCPDSVLQDDSTANSCAMEHYTNIYVPNWSDVKLKASNI